LDDWAISIEIIDGASMVAFLEFDVWIWAPLMGYTEWVS
jgi:hypothetical protein